MQHIKQLPLADSIKKILTIGASALAFSAISVQAETYINPHEIWLIVGEKNKICGVDFDHDGDVDLFSYYKDVITLHENIGIPSSPKFAPEKAFVDRSNLMSVEALGLNTPFCSGGEGWPDQTEVDIDNDGDLDLFRRAIHKGKTPLQYSVDFYENTGTKEHPIYAGTRTEHTMGLPSEPSAYFIFIFTDIDGDGDMDFFHQSFLVADDGSTDKQKPVFYENTGSAAQAQFVKQDNNPVNAICSGNKIDYFIDLNNDNRVDIVCAEGTIALSNGSGYTITHDLLKPATQTSLRSSHTLQTTDFDQDGDVDIVGLPRGAIDKDIFGGYKLDTMYSAKNVSESLVPQFELKRIALNRMGSGFDVREDYFYADLNGDNALDLIYAENGGFNYIVNTGSSSKPQYDFKLGVDTAIFKQCVIENNVNSFLKFIDIDGDGDLDLFTPNYSSFSENGTAYCENKGSQTSPLFSSSVYDPVWMGSSSGNLLFGDLDGDGDQDFVSGAKLYDNIGTAQQPFFQSTSYTPTDTRRNSIWVDMDNDGRMDSILHNRRDTSDGFNDQAHLLYKGLEPATGITVAKAKNGIDQISIAVNRPSQVQLYSCAITGYACRSGMLPFTAQEVSLVTGYFSKGRVSDGTSRVGEIALATVDKEGLINVNIYRDQVNGSPFQLLSSGKGGKAHSISIAAGQLDDDFEDEIVVTFVQEDDTIVVAAINDDMSVIGIAQVGKGKHPSVAVGNFSVNGGRYVLSYISPDNQLKTAVFQANGTLISQGAGGYASYASVSNATFLPENPNDEYVVSTRQENGVVGLVGFSSDGSVLGQLTGGVAQQPTVISRDASQGLVASVIQADKKPAVIFLNNNGEYLATGVGSHKATVATVVTWCDWDCLVQGLVNESTALVYLDENGIPRWEVFGTDGVRK